MGEMCLQELSILIQGFFYVCVYIYTEKNCKFLDLKNFIQIWKIIIGFDQAHTHTSRGVVNKG